MNITERILYLSAALENWLSPDNHHLSQAVDRTVKEGYFAFHDVKHALRALRRSCSEAALRHWASEAGLLEEGAGGLACDSLPPSGSRPAEQPRSAPPGGPLTLCLHAGNLPLAGLQDVLAVMLGGGRYSGKISRKDPYLLPTFLNEVKKTAGWNDREAQWTHRLDDFEGMSHDAVLFAGSGSSVPPVREAIHGLGLAGPGTRFLIRTAHFSMAYVDRKEPRVMEELTEAIFRYGGMGCRSVAVVVAPWSLDEIKCDLTDYVESFWLENPQHLEPPPALKYRFAYNKAVERPQAWLDRFLLQQRGMELDQDFITCWVQGDEERAAELATQFGPRLQSIYVPHPDLEIPGWQERTEFLSDAQQPPLHWKPDGTDPLRWLTSPEERN